MTAHDPDSNSRKPRYPYDNDSVDRKQIRQRMVELVRIGCQRTAPVASLCGQILREQARKIHRTADWRNRCSKTLFSNSVSLAMGMLAAYIVESSVEVSRFSNLWGLLASKPVVSESTFEVIIFVVKFSVTVIVFTLTEHFISEYRQRRSIPE